MGELWGEEQLPLWLLAILYVNTSSQIPQQRGQRWINWRGEHSVSSSPHWPNVEKTLRKQGVSLVINSVIKRTGDFLFSIISNNRHPPLYLQIQTWTGLCFLQWHEVIADVVNRQGCGLISTCLQTEDRHTLRPIRGHTATVTSGHDLHRAGGKHSLSQCK